MDIIKIKETCLYVTDLDRTRLFYEGKLGFEVIGAVAGRHVFFRAGASVLLCFIAAVSAESKTLPPHYGQGQLHVAFEVKQAEYQSWKKLLETQQIAMEQEYDWGDGYLSFYFRDPDQHLLEIVMEGMWERS